MTEEKVPEKTPETKPRVAKKDTAAAEKFQEKVPESKPKTAKKDSVADDTMPESRGKTPKRDFYDVLTNIDVRKATKYIIKGMIIAIIFGTIALTSRTLASYADEWYNWQFQLNENNYMEGVYGYAEYAKQLNYIDATQRFLQFQVVIVANVSRLGINLGLILVLIGFIAYSLNKEMDEKWRRIALVLAGVVVTVIMFTSLFTNISVNIS